MGNRLQGKVAVVTGGGRGIGRGIALLLAEEGVSVVVNDLGCEVDGTGSSNVPADQVAAEIKKAGGNAVASYDNVATMDGAESAIKAAVDDFGQLDVLVNSVGIMKDRMIHRMTPAEFDVVIRNNLKSAFAPTKFAGILFRQQRNGRIVNITSDAGLGAIGRSSYAAASEGIVGLTRTVGRDLGRYGVTCNAIAPLVETRLSPGIVEQYRSDRGPEPTPEQRVGYGPLPPTEDWDGPGGPNDPENVAPLAVYLCTYASPNINGYVLGVRGGGIYVYSNPEVEKSIDKGALFTMDDMDALVPKVLGTGF